MDSSKLSPLALKFSHLLNRFLQIQDGAFLLISNYGNILQRLRVRGLIDDGHDLIQIATSRLSGRGSIGQL